MTLYETITAAVREFEQNGYQSSERLAYWTAKIREAAERDLVPENQLVKTLRDTLGQKFNQVASTDALLKKHVGVDRFTIDRIKPKLRAELDRRIMASADLIKMNREESINKTIQRFQGWATSIPAGGSTQVETVDVKKHIRKTMAQLPFAERRVLIDQGHKLLASINEIVAVDGGAIAMRWHSHYRQAGYDYREDHKERDGHVYAVRGNWAIEKGLMKAGPDGYTDDLTRPAEEPFCRCNYQPLYGLRQLPSDMLTDKGREALKAGAQNSAASKVTISVRAK